MSRISVTIKSEDDRRRAVAAVVGAKLGMRVDIKEEKRSHDQNSKLWACLHDISEQVPWPSLNGQRVKLSPDEYKQLFMSALKGELKLVPNIDGNGLVSLGRSSSDLSKEEFSNLLELVLMFGANHNVQFSEPDSAQPASKTEPDTPAVEQSPQPATAGTHSESSALAPAGENGGDDAITPAPSPASLLSPDWRSVYITTMTGATTKAMSIAKRHETAIQMIGGEPNEPELTWMRLVARAATRRDRGQMAADEFRSEIERLWNAPLEPVTEAA